MNGIERQLASSGCYFLDLTPSESNIPSKPEKKRLAAYSTAKQLAVQHDLQQVPKHALLASQQLGSSLETSENWASLGRRLFKVRKSRPMMTFIMFFINLHRYVSQAHTKASWKAVEKPTKIWWWSILSDLSYTFASHSLNLKPRKQSIQATSTQITTSWDLFCHPLHPGTFSLLEMGTAWRRASFGKTSEQSTASLYTRLRGQPNVLGFFSLKAVNVQQKWRQKKRSQLGKGQNK